MAQRETPEAWRVLMDRKGIASARALSVRAGVSVQAVLRLMHGEGEPTEDVVAAVADALDVKPSRIRHLAAVPAGEDEPFTLPPEANRLTRRQREAVVEIVRLLLDAGNVVPLSAAPGRPSSSAGGRGQKVAARRDRDPDETGRH